MEIKHQISNNEVEIKCFSIISNPKDRHYGEKCGRLLMKKNSKDKAAGQIKCQRCKAIYDIVDGKITLISRGD